MASIVELYPARRQEVLEELKADMRQRLDVLRNANESYYDLLSELELHLENCRKVLRALPNSQVKENLEDEVDKRQASILTLRSQCDHRRRLAESAMAQYR